MAAFARISAVGQYAATVADVLPLIAELKVDQGRQFGALAIDGISVLWQNLQPAREIDQRGWGVIKRQWNQMVNALTTLSIPVVLTAHEHIDEAKQVRPDAEKNIMHWPDLAVQLRQDHSSVVRAVRGTQLAVGTVIRSPSAKTILAEMAPKQTVVTA